MTAEQRNGSVAASLRSSVPWALVFGAIAWAARGARFGAIVVVVTLIAHVGGARWRGRDARMRMVPAIVAGFLVAFVLVLALH
jgi:hypothetical protein